MSVEARDDYHLLHNFQQRFLVLIVFGFAILMD